MVSENNIDYVIHKAIEHGILDNRCIAHMQEDIERMERKDIISQHKYSIKQGKDGYWRTYLPLQDGNRKMLKKKNEKDLYDTLVSFYRERNDSPTIRDIFKEWNDLRLEYNKIANSTHLRNTQVFNRHYSVFGSKHIKDVTPEQFQDFLEEELAKKELTPKSFSNLKTITRGIIKRAKRRKLITYSDSIVNDIDVSDRDFKVTFKEDYEEVFTDDELPIMLRYLADHPDIHNLGILLMFVTGVRVGELVALKYEDLNFINFKDADINRTGCYLQIRRTETRYKKDGNYVLEVKETPKTKAGIRKVAVPIEYQWIFKSLRKLNPFGEYVFMYKGHRLSAQSIRMRMRNICSTLPVYEKSPHKARKTYLSILMDNGLDDCFITGQAGHTNISCTEKNYHRNRKTMETKVRIVSELPELMVK